MASNADLHYIITQIKGYFSEKVDRDELGDAASKTVANNLTTTDAGYVLDGRQGAAIKTLIDTTNTTVSQKANQTDLSATNTVVATKANQSDLDSLNDSLVNNFGGTNLLPGTKDFSEISSKTYVTAETYRGFTIAHADRSSEATTVFNDFSWDSAIQVEPDTWYTLSFWAKGTGKIQSHFWTSTEATIQSGINSSGVTTVSGNGTIETTVTSEWKRYWISWKTKSDVTESVLRTLVAVRVWGGNDIYVCGVMFEHGQIAHDWDYSPKDVVTNDSLAKVGAVSNKSDYFGATTLPGGLKMCWGYAAVPAGTANTPSTVVVTFPIAFTAIPNIQITGITSAAGTVLLGVTYQNATKTGCTIYSTRTDAGAQGVTWFAVGY